METAARRALPARAEAVSSTNRNPVETANMKPPCRWLDGQTLMPRGVVPSLARMAFAVGVRVNISGPDAVELMPARMPICLKIVSKNKAVSRMGR